MTRNKIVDMSIAARKAIQAQNWQAVSVYAKKICELDPKEPEGTFLSGIYKKNRGQVLDAIAEFRRTLNLNQKRYDAAIEMASLLLHTGHHLDALAFIEKYETYLANSPLYLDMAGSIFAKLGLHDKANILFTKADFLQPNVERIQANLATSSVYTGKITEAIQIYKALLKRFPYHQRYHYELSRLAKASNSQHIDAMRNCLIETNLPDEKNIFIYYALGKELEDLQRWDEAFHYYQIAGNAAKSASKYKVEQDISIIERIIKTCDKKWLEENPTHHHEAFEAKTPIFIVGLPRTGTTLVERIISSHSKVSSADETFFMQIALQRASNTKASALMTPETIAKAASGNIHQIANDYLQSIGYKLNNKPIFIEKLPENFLYLGFIAKAFPNAKIIHLRRNAMDACFSLYKQSYFRYAYNLSDLGQYYISYERLNRHWRKTLKDRIIEISYEDLVADQEVQTKWLLNQLGLKFEDACLNFHKNATVSATASAAQVREKIYSDSVFKWKNFSKQLEPLRKTLENAGVNIFP